MDSCTWFLRTLPSSEDTQPSLKCATGDGKRYFTASSPWELTVAMFSVRNHYKRCGHEFDLVRCFRLMSRHSVVTNCSVARWDGQHRSFVLGYYSFCRRYNATIAIANLVQFTQPIASLRIVWTPVGSSKLSLITALHRALTPIHAH